LKKASSCLREGSMRFSPSALPNNNSGLRVFLHIRAMLLFLFPEVLQAYSEELCAWLKT
jgi:hypothetical protein